MRSIRLRAILALGVLVMPLDLPPAIVSAGAGQPTTLYRLGRARVARSHGQRGQQHH
jgi:hypothetical protein